MRVRVKLGSIGVWTRELGSSEKDQRVDVLGNAVGHPGNHHPTVAVADQHRVLDPLGLRGCDGPGSDLAFLVAAVMLLQRERYGPCGCPRRAFEQESKIQPEPS